MGSLSVPLIALWYLEGTWSSLIIPNMEFVAGCLFGWGLFERSWFRLFSRSIFSSQFATYFDIFNALALVVSMAISCKI